MEQPDGFTLRSEKHLVYLSLKAIYGLKQASRAWQTLVCKCFSSIGARKSWADCSLYILQYKGKDVHALVYVDDMFFVSETRCILKEIAAQIANIFDVRISYRVKRFLGIIIKRGKVSGSVKIHSCSLIDQMQFKFHMTDCKPCLTPLPPFLALTQDMKAVEEGEDRTVAPTPYQQVMGCLPHLSNTARPDVCFAANYLARFMQSPSTADWKAFKHVLRCLAWTKKKGTIYKPQDTDGNVSSLVGYSDSDYAGDRDERNSTSGYVLLNTGGAVSWRIRRQTVTAQNNVEFEYIAFVFRSS